MFAQRHSRHLAFCLLLLAVCWFYLSSLDFGFVWDDPVWYGHVVGKTWLDLVKPTTEFHFYRPGSFLYNRLFLRETGTFADTHLHLMQVYWHLLNISLIFAICLRLGLSRWPAFTVAGLVAVFPFSYQAIAWTAPGQPWTAAFQQGAWLAYLVGRRPDLGLDDSGLNKAATQSRPMATFLSLFLFCCALALQESTVPLALVPLLFELMFRSNSTRWQTVRIIAGLHIKIPPYLALIYPLLALLFLLIWIQVPRYPGIIGLSLDAEAGAYLLQGFIYPLLGRVGGYEPGKSVTPIAIYFLSTGTLLLLWWMANGRRRSRVAVAGLVWAILSIIPSFAGLNFSYVSHGPRLLYFAAPGINMLWVAGLWPKAVKPNRIRQFVGILFLALILVQCSLLLNGFKRLYQTGVWHLTEAVGIMDRSQGRYLFINFPDQFRSRRSPYPNGYWGVTLAPVAVDLADFPPLLTGIRAKSTSRAIPWVDTQARSDGPLKVDMRGVIIPADELYRLAALHDEVYLSRYYLDGSMELQLAGSLRELSPTSCQLAIFDDTVCLQSIQISNHGDDMEIELSWFTEKALSPNMTIFLHVGKPGEAPLAQADGDTWLGMLPLTLWQPGDLVRERRIVRGVGPGEGLVLSIGLYDRLTGQRVPIRSIDQRPLPDNSYYRSVMP